MEVQADRHKRILADIENLCPFSFSNATHLSPKEGFTEDRRPDYLDGAPKNERNLQL
jgi:hypothetical protein